VSPHFFPRASAIAKAVVRVAEGKDPFWKTAW
jgi:hypothetical protein